MIKPLFVLLIICVSLSTMGAGPISVGHNLQVSSPNPQWSHDEIILSVDPVHPNRMVACGIVHIAATAQRTDIIYASQDRGRSWKQTLLAPEQSSDPICRFGTDGTAYFVTENVLPNGVTIYTSSDGGMTWTLRRHTSLSLPGYDRHFAAVDDTNSKYRGRVYIDAWSFVRSVEGEGRENTFEGLGLYHTDDDGATWSDIMRRVSNGYNVRVDLPGNCDVFTSGALACIFLQNTKSDTGLSREVRIMTTPPGGALFLPAIDVAGGAFTAPCPQLAIDRYTSTFRNRVYAVWGSWNGTYSDVMLSYSLDRGQTWSKPLVVNDDHTNPPATVGMHDLPEVAVNRNGVVGVMWYDHREDPKGHNYRPRFAASFDGGETFASSVAIATAPHAFGIGEHWGLEVVPDRYEGLNSFFTQPKPLTPLSIGIDATSGSGDTASLVADTTGTFWGLWIDNRTKYDQMWTAPITVAGTAVRHGSVDLAPLDDISSKTAAHYSNISMNDARTIVSVTMQLKNISSQDLIGPLAGRILTLSSTVGNPVALNAQNGRRGVGAVWRFAVAGSGVLHPGQYSLPKKLIFRLLNPLALKKKGGTLRETFLVGELVNFDFQVLGKTSGAGDPDAQ